MRATLPAEVVRYAVHCQSSTGWFRLDVTTTSRWRALKLAAEMIAARGWDGIPRSVHRA